MAWDTDSSDPILDTGSHQPPTEENEDTLYYILMALFSFAMMGGIIFFGGMLRLTLGILILILIGFNLVYWSMEETEKSDIWKREGEYDEEVNLKLKKNSDLVRRAFNGMELSQSYLEKKIMDLCLDKLKENRNISEEEIRALLNDPDEFREIVGDDVVCDFILSKNKQNDVESLMDDQSPPERSDKENYKRWISTLVERIEGWE